MNCSAIFAGHIIKKMMQAKKQIIGKKSPYTDCFTPLHNYHVSLENNVSELKRKFPSHDLLQLKELLEELDNNLDIAESILEEEQGPKNIPPPINTPKLCLSEENKLLKNAIRTLYKKIKTMKKETNILAAQNQQISRQNESYKINNRFLIDGQLSSIQQQFNHHIY